jgi:hypothetical protein
MKQREAVNARLEALKKGKDRMVSWFNARIGCVATFRAAGW